MYLRFACCLAAEYVQFEAMTLKALAVSGGIAASLYFGMGFTGVPLAIFSLMAFLGFGGLATTRLLYRTGPRDARQA